MLTMTWLKGFEDLSSAYGVREALGFGEDEKDCISWHGVVMIENTAVATATLTPYKDGFILKYMGVIKEHRNKGIGDFLMRGIDQKMQSMRDYNLYALEIDSFLSKYGFETVGEDIVCHKVILPVYCKSFKK